MQHKYLRACKFLIANHSRSFCTMHMVFFIICCPVIRICLATTSFSKVCVASCSSGCDNILSYFLLHYCWLILLCTPHLWTIKSIPFYSYLISTYSLSHSWKLFLQPLNLLHSNYAHFIFRSHYSSTDLFMNLGHMRLILLQSIFMLLSWHHFTATHSQNLGSHV